MNKSPTYKIIPVIAESYKYKSKGLLFWNSHEDLTKLVQLQPSKWGKGIYVNFGITPTQMITKSSPPESGYWGLQARGETFPGPSQEIFRQVASGNKDVSEAEISEAVRWLFSWLEFSFNNSEHIRRWIAQKDQNSPIALFGAISDEWIMADWASYSLKPPATYFPPSDSYYTQV